MADRAADGRRSGFEPCPGSRGRLDIAASVGYRQVTMSVRSDLRLMKHVPAPAGRQSFGRIERMLAPTNAPRG